MIIGFDAKRAIGNYTGLGNYSRYVIDILSNYFKNNKYYLFSPRNGCDNPCYSLLERDNVTIITPKSFIGKKFKSIWRTLFIVKNIKAHHIEIYHGLSNEIPVRIKKNKIKSIVTIHDLIFLQYPKFYRFVDRTIYNLKFKYACKNANRIIAVSNCTKNDIIRFYHIPSEKIDVIYQGCNAAFMEKVDDATLTEIKSKYNLPDQFLLFVGSIEERKNLMLVVKSLVNVPVNIHLVTVGKETKYTKLVREFAESNGLANRIHYLHNIPLEELPAIYQQAKIFVYPSFYEGFGIPVIEAIHSGLPVIAATGSCLEEAGGPDSIYVDPTNWEEMGESINKILNNPGLAQNMITNGLNYVKQFSEKEIAEQLIKAYQKTLSGQK